MNIALEFNSLIDRGDLDELAAYLDNLTKDSLSFNDTLHVSYGLHRINRTADAIEVISKFESDDITMIALAHQKGIYRIATGEFSAAIVDFESVISAESRHNTYFCTPEAKFFECICHIKIGSAKGYHLARQLDNDTKVFYENKIWNKASIIDLSHGIIR